MQTFNITNARSNLFKLAKDTVDSHEPILLTGKNGDVILISKDDYEAMQETIFLHTNRGLAEEAKKLKNASDDEFSSRDELPW